MQPSSSARSTAVEMPPAAETWAPYSTPATLPGCCRCRAASGCAPFHPQAVAADGTAGPVRSRSRFSTGSSPWTRRLAAQREPGRTPTGDYAAPRGDGRRRPHRRAPRARLSAAVRRDDDHDRRRPARGDRARLRRSRHRLRNRARARLRRQAGRPGARRDRRRRPFRPHPPQPRPRGRVARPGRRAGADGGQRALRRWRRRCDRRPAGGVRRRAGPRPPRRDRARPADREPRSGSSRRTPCRV